MQEGKHKTISHLPEMYKLVREQQVKQQTNKMSHYEQAEENWLVLWRPASVGDQLWTDWPWEASLRKWHQLRHKRREEKRLGRVGKSWGETLVGGMSRWGSSREGLTKPHQGRESLKPFRALTWRIRTQKGRQTSLGRGDEPLKRVKSVVRCWSPSTKVGRWGLRWPESRTGYPWQWAAACIYSHVP